MKTLVAGFGNLLWADDGFGVEVVRRLNQEGPCGAEVIDVGIGGFDLVLKLMDGFDHAILVDAVYRKNAPGTLYVFQPTSEEVTLQAGERIDPHFAEPTRALKLAGRLRAMPGAVTVVGCEPGRIDLFLGLSPKVEAAVAPAMAKIRALVQEGATRGS